MRHGLKKINPNLTRGARHHSLTTRAPPPSLSHHGPASKSRMMLPKSRLPTRRVYRSFGFSRYFTNLSISSPTCHTAAPVRGSGARGRNRGWRHPPTQEPRVHGLAAYPPPLRGGGFQPAVLESAEIGNKSRIFPRMFGIISLVVLRDHWEKKSRSRTPLLRQILRKSGPTKGGGGVSGGPQPPSLPSLSIPGRGGGSLNRTKAYLGVWCRTMNKERTRNNDAQKNTGKKAQRQWEKNGGFWSGRGGNCFRNSRAVIMGLAAKTLPPCSRYTTGGVCLPMPPSGRGTCWASSRVGSMMIAVGWCPSPSRASLILWEGRTLGPPGRKYVSIENMYQINRNKINGEYRTYLNINLARGGKYLFKRLQDFFTTGTRNYTKLLLLRLQDYVRCKITEMTLAKDSLKCDGEARILPKVISVQRWYCRGDLTCKHTLRNSVHECTKYSPNNLLPPLLLDTP